MICGGEDRGAVTSGETSAFTTPPRELDFAKFACRFACGALGLTCGAAEELLCEGDATLALLLAALLVLAASLVFFRRDEATLCFGGAFRFNVKSLAWRGRMRRGVRWQISTKIGEHEKLLVSGVGEIMVQWHWLKC